MSEDQARAREAASRVTEDSERVAGELRALDAEVAAATARRGELQAHRESLKVGGRGEGSGVGAALTLLDEEVWELSLIHISEPTRPY